LPKYATSTAPDVESEVDATVGTEIREAGSGRLEDAEDSLHREVFLVSEVG
jgi:hypothetical protein